MGARFLRENRTETEVAVVVQAVDFLFCLHADFILLYSNQICRECQTTKILDCVLICVAEE
jgi:hypothetical protein